MSQTPTLILERRKGSRNSEAKPQFGHRDGVIPCDRCCNPWVSCLLLPPGGWVGMQVKILTRTMKVKSEHHKVSGSSSAKAHRIRAANLPSHRLSEIQRSEVVRSAGGKLSPIGYSCHRKPASINETIILFLRGTLGTQLLGAGGGGSGIHHRDKELGADWQLKPHCRPSEVANGPFRGCDESHAAQPAFSRGSRR